MSGRAGTPWLGSDAHQLPLLEYLGSTFVRAAAAICRTEAEAAGAASGISRVQEEGPNAALVTSGAFHILLEMGDGGGRCQEPKCVGGDGGTRGGAHLAEAPARVQVTHFTLCALLVTVAPAAVWESIKPGHASITLTTHDVVLAPE